MVSAQSQNFASMPELFAAEEFLGDALTKLKSASVDERGAIFTKPEVVNFMLDLIGYTPDRPLWQFRLLEPSFGAGEFLLKAVERLLESFKKSDAEPDSLCDAIRGVELHQESFQQTKNALIELLKHRGMTTKQSVKLAGDWLTNGDFLLEPFVCGFDFVIGNPPYVRQELIPAELLAEYRQRYVTLYDRADLYVPFMQRSLDLLNAGGQMSFICSDRWMKNRYGGPLRAMISCGYSLRYYVDMVGTDAFQSEVTAYPAITVIQRGKSHAKPLLAHRPEISSASLSQLHRIFTGPQSDYNGTVSILSAIPKADEPWLLESDAQPSLELVRRLEERFPLMEEAGCSVGIGVATGADKVYIGPLDELDVEDERKLPLVTTRDILEGSVNWKGLGVVNPFEENGSLANLQSYPRFARFIHEHREVLMKRHCAQKASGSWYRTIDRITPSLAKRPKLLVPDIKGEAHIVLEEGRLYPHHNLYYIVSDEWPLAALQAVLQSGIARLFVRAYSTKMRGGALRFQAQYLRRIRLPRWSGLTSKQQMKLTEPDPTAIQRVVAEIYHLTAEDELHLTN